MQADHQNAKTPKTNAATMNQSDESRCLWLAEVAAWLQAYRKAQVDCRERNCF